MTLQQVTHACEPYHISLSKLNLEFLTLTTIFYFFQGWKLEVGRRIDSSACTRATQIIFHIKFGEHMHG